MICSCNCPQELREYIRIELLKMTRDIKQRMDSMEYRELGRDKSREDEAPALWQVRDELMKNRMEIDKIQAILETVQNNQKVLGSKPKSTKKD